ncbi:SGNH/GDSL hydrolase family protein [uncultured Photobacterium sp.]|uniref:SGNH/GDSL hydrolase family protein n=1 Tax=uncultured Photobacterium sp. TaxID=173973 RepID=UPI0026092939|nr:SGNH/GDSL hydrolase family protein [uncultured Photobacterium sp.]
MKKTLLAISILLPFCGAASATETIKPEDITAEAVRSVQASETYTYARCWYRTGNNHNEPATSWEWALNDDGSYYTVNGYWYSSHLYSFMNMFFTDTPQEEIKAQCEKTLGVEHEAADITFFASDYKYSYNHSFWTNDSSNQPAKINKIISFGDSISDTGNLFNGFQWTFPNSNSWFLGHFSNGFVWTEYLANEKNLPLYTWAVGGAAGNTQYKLLSGIHDQVDSYLTYMKMAKNYQPENSLFTIEFGLNDFINYNRSVEDVTKDYARALKRLTDHGAKNILALTLPDATIAPQFKYSDPQEAVVVSKKIEEFNQFIKAEVLKYQLQGINISLYDTTALFNNISTSPEKYGFHNVTDACLNINRSSSKDYLMSHSLTNECATYGSDSYMFWGVTHPTTKTHKVLAEQINKSALDQFTF